MNPIGTGLHIDPWYRTRQLGTWLRKAKATTQLTADNIMWDGVIFHLQPRKTLRDYPGHTKARAHLLAQLSEAAPLRPPGPGVDGLKQLIRDLPFANGVGVEVGSYIGESTLVFVDSDKFASLTCVDIWLDWAAPGEAVFDERTKDNPVITKLRLPSIEAAATFPDASLDFCYIDADHKYDSVKADILAWKPKVKPGGVLAGHDYNKHHNGLKRAVRELLGPPNRVYRDHSWAIRV